MLLCTGTCCLRGCLEMTETFVVLPNRARESSCNVLHTYTTRAHVNALPQSKCMHACLAQQLDISRRFFRTALRNDGRSRRTITRERSDAAGGDVLWIRIVRLLSHFIANASCQPTVLVVFHVCSTTLMCQCRGGSLVHCV